MPKQRLSIPRSFVRAYILLIAFIPIGNIHVYANHQVDSLLHMVEQHEQKGHMEALLYTYIELASTYKQSYDHKEAVGVLKKALPIARAEKNKSAEFAILNDLGWISFWLDAYPQALDYLFRAREIAVEHLPLNAQSDNLSRIARTYINLGNYQQALYHQLQALSLSEQVDDSLGMATAYHYIGSIYFNRSQYDQALKHMRKALTIYTNTGHDIEIYTVLATMSSIYTRQGFLSRAKQFAERSLDLAQDIDYPYGLAFSTGMIGMVEKEKGEYDQALPFLQKAISMMEGQNVQAEQAQFMISEAEVFLAQGQHDSARFVLQKALHATNKIGALALVKQAALTLSQVYEAQGIDDSAFHYLKWHYRLQDSLDRQVSLEQLSNLETEFQIQRKQDQIELIEKQRRTDRVTFYVFGLGLSFVLLIVVIWLLYGRYRNEAQTAEQLSRKNLQIEQRNAQLSQANAELGQFAEVAIADLRSPLRDIQKLLAASLSLTDISPKVYSLLSRMEAVLSGLSMYAILGKQNPEAIEIDMNDVISEAIRLLPEDLKRQATRIHVKPLPSVRGHRRQLVQLFQQLLSNSIKYRAEVEPRIEIQGIPAGDMHLFSVRDNGQGMTEEEQHRAFSLYARIEDEPGKITKGIGLAVCRKIVEQHGGQIWVESRAEAGSTFFFTLPPALVGGHPRPATYTQEIPMESASAPSTT